MGNLVVFIVLSLVILSGAILCVSTRRIMRSATFLLFVLFGVAGIYFLLDYTYLGAAQITVYAGGVVILYIFAIQLMKKRTLQGLAEQFKHSRLIQGLLVSAAGLATVTAIVMKNSFISMSVGMTDAEVPVKTIGESLVGSERFGYVLPFEFVALFLLACIIGGIMVARKENRK